VLQVGHGSHHALSGALRVHAALLRTAVWPALGPWPARRVLAALATRRLPFGSALPRGVLRVEPALAAFALGHGRIESLRTLAIGIRAAVLTTAALAFGPSTLATGLVLLAAETLGLFLERLDVGHDAFALLGREADLQGRVFGHERGHGPAEGLWGHRLAGHAALLASIHREARFDAGQALVPHLRPGQHRPILAALSLGTVGPRFGAVLGGCRSRCDGHTNSGQQRQACSCCVVHVKPPVHLAVHLESCASGGLLESLFRRSRPPERLGHHPYNEPGRS
jgi:hypothetical protein